MKNVLISLFFGLFILAVQAEETKVKLPEKEIKALIVTGGCCHDYEAQKTIIGEGLKSRLNFTYDILMEMKTEDMKTALSKEDWHKNYELIIYNICHAHETDQAFIESVAKVHEEGKPAIVLHCTMHSYHWKIKGEKKAWTEFLGVTSPKHGPKSKINVVPTEDAKEHPVMKGFPVEWLTPQGELYNITKVHENTKVLAMGTKTEKGDKDPQPCIWVNTYGKGKVFGTTLGHHNETMQHEVYLDLLARAALWVTDNLK